MNSLIGVPFVTLLMPIRNEEAFIRRSLEAVLNQNYSQDRMEIIVTDGMSTDSTCQIVQGYQKEHPNLRLIDNPGRIVPAGINAALRRAKGDVIVRVDGHTLIAEDYVSRCVEALQTSGADDVGGRMDATGEGSFAEAVVLATSSPFGVGGARFHYSEKEEWVDTVYMGAWPRRVFEKIGLFDEELVRDQDDEFNYRLREQGGRILLSPNIKSKYTVRSTPKALWKQYFQYGYWKVRVLQKHPLQMRPRQFVPLAFVAALIGSVLFSMVFFWGWVTLLTVAGTYLLANLAASEITASKNGRGHFLLLPLVYAILHLSYGLGFLVGLVKFANRWRDKQGKVPELN